jgi:hypothetical protein
MLWSFYTPDERAPGAHYIRGFTQREVPLQISLRTGICVSHFKRSHSVAAALIEKKHKHAEFVMRNLGLQHGSIKDIYQIHC